MLHIVTLRSLCYVCAVHGVHSKSILFGTSRPRFSRNRCSLRPTIAIIIILLYYAPIIWILNSLYSFII